MQSLKRDHAYLPIFQLRVLGAKRVNGSWLLCYCWGGGGVALKFLNKITLQDNLRSTGQISPEVFIMKISSAWQNVEGQWICSVWRISVCFIR